MNRYGFEAHGPAVEDLRAAVVKAQREHDEAKKRANDAEAALEEAKEKLSQTYLRVRVEQVLTPFDASSLAEATLALREWANVSFAGANPRPISLHGVEALLRLGVGCVRDVAAALPEEHPRKREMLALVAGMDAGR